MAVVRACLLYSSIEWYITGNIDGSAGYPVPCLRIKPLCTAQVVRSLSFSPYQYIHHTQSCNRVSASSGDLQYDVVAKAIPVNQGQTSGVLLLID